MLLVVGALALAFTAAVLIAASFAARWATARWLHVSGIGPFGVRARSGLASAGWPRRITVHASALASAYLVSALLFASAFLIGGEEAPTTRVEVLPGPAMEAGIQDGDRIVRVEEQLIDDWDELRSQIRSRASMPTRIEVERDDKLKTILVTPGGDGVIRVKPIPERRPLGVVTATLRALVQPASIILATARSFFEIVIGTEKAQLTGAVGLSREVGSTGERSFVEMLFVLGLLAAYVWPALLLLEIIIAIVAARSLPARSTR